VEILICSREGRQKREREEREREKISEMAVTM
jgi:hypothetical protein